MKIENLPPQVCIGGVQLAPVWTPTARTGFRRWFMPATQYAPLFTVDPWDYQIPLDAQICHRPMILDIGGDQLEQFWLVNQVSLEPGSLQHRLCAAHALLVESGVAYVLARLRQANSLRPENALPENPDPFDTYLLTVPVVARITPVDLGATTEPASRGDFHRRLGFPLNNFDAVVLRMGDHGAQTTVELIQKFYPALPIGLETRMDGMDLHDLPPGIDFIIEVE